MPDATGAVHATCEANLDNNVKDPILREKLRPDYRAACKRLIMSETFYDAIQHPNAELVTEGIERIEPKGIPVAWPFTFDRFTEEMEKPIFEHYEMKA